MMSEKSTGPWDKGRNIIQLLEFEVKTSQCVISCVIVTESRFHVCAWSKVAAAFNTGFLLQLTSVAGRLDQRGFNVGLSLFLKRGKPCVILKEKYY